MDMVLHTADRPAWRAVLETRWQQRLGTVTRLSLAYHDAAERLPGGNRAADQGGSRELRRLMRETVAARRALSDTEEALARLSAGTFGRCEQCAAAIPVTRLAREPEARYCERCARQAAPAIVSISAPSPAHGACTAHR
jgi:RNA polymerase-binding transcription factor DksA